MKLYFERPDEDHPQFWKIILEDQTITTIYGTIDTEGQTNVVQSPTLEEAITLFNQMAQEKIKHGYREQQPGVSHHFLGDL